MNDELMKLALESAMPLFYELVGHYALSGDDFMQTESGKRFQVFMGCAANLGWREIAGEGGEALDPGKYKWVREKKALAGWGN